MKIATYLSALSDRPEMKGRASAGDDDTADQISKMEIKKIWHKPDDPDMQLNQCTDFR